MRGETTQTLALRLCQFSTTLLLVYLLLILVELSLLPYPALPCPASSCLFDPCSDVFRWFARLLLEGSVLPELRSVLRRDRLKDSPALITQMKPSTKVRRTDRQIGKLHLV